MRAWRVRRARQDRRVNLDELVTLIRTRPRDVRLVAIDGPGGAGKTTFAARLADAAGGAPVLHTDDFASADNPIDWWPRMLAEVIEPLSRGHAAIYQRYDWASESLAEWHTVDPAPIVIIEGVSAGRAEWAEHLSLVIWVETPRDERLRRGVERDGVDALDDWDGWMAAEDAHYARDPTRERAHVEVDGTEAERIRLARDPVEHRIVAAVLVQDGRVLLCHRHPERRWFPNVWDLPGGHIDDGEEPITALVRELREELGIEVQVDDATYVMHGAPTPNVGAPDVDVPDVDVPDVDVTVWAFDRWGGTITNADPAEHDRIGWFTEAEIAELVLADTGVAEACAIGVRLLRGGA